MHYTTLQAEISAVFGHNDLSLKWYKKRTEAGDYRGDLFYAYLMLGHDYLDYGEKEYAAQAYLKALEASPERPEPFYFLSRFYRLNRDFEQSIHYAMEGKKRPCPKEGSFFVLKEVTDYLLDSELSISGFYTRHKKCGFEALNRLILNRKAPSNLKFYGLNNALHYVEPITAALIPVDVVPPKISDNENYYPMNPSIQKSTTGYDIICRTVNFGQKEAKEYWSRDPGNPKVSTRNFLIKTDKSFKRLSQEEIVEASDYPRFPHWFAEGVEDCRLFHFRGENWFTCSLYDANPSNTIQIGLGKIEGEGARLTPLRGPERGRCEKNWLPFEFNGEVHAVYSHDPFTVFRVDPVNGLCKKIIETNCPLDCSRFRGSAGPIPFDEGYLTLVHEVAYPGRRYYLHRFVYLDRDFHITKLSSPFYFKTVGIEYCAGMTLDHEGKNLVMSLGVEDKEAYLAITPIEEVKLSLIHKTSDSL